MPSPHDTRKPDALRPYDHQTAVMHTDQGDITVDLDAWPTGVSWGGVPGHPETDPYQVIFDSTARPLDTGFDAPDGQLGQDTGTPRQTRMLQALRVASRQDGVNWQLVRQYNLIMGACATTDGSDATYVTSDDTSGSTLSVQKLTLCSVQRLGNDGASILDWTNFTYGAPALSNGFLAGSANRLTTISTSHGGGVTFAYETVGATLTGQWDDDAGLMFGNYHRVTRKTVDGGFGTSPSTWSYTYQNPELNELGSVFDPGRTAVRSAYANDPGLVINFFFPGGPCCGNNNYWLYLLAARNLTEFRGHKIVTVTNPDGSTSVHSFFQGDPVPEVGDTVCPTPSYGDQVGSYATDPCFQPILRNSALRGREFRVVTTDPHGVAIEQTDTHYTVTTDYGAQTLSGMVRGTVFRDQVTQTILDPAGGTTSTVTTYNYDGTYGNLMTVKEYSGAAPTLNALYRRTEYIYALTDNTETGGGTYLVDHRAQETIYDGAGTAFAMSQTFYDGIMTVGGIDIRGDATHTRAYYDLNGSHSADTAQTFDTYGNRLSVATFTGPDGTGAARTTTTAYDPTFHALPIQITSPSVGSVTLTEQATYDLQMGTLTSVTDANGAITNATYDLFGRQTSLTRPGEAAGDLTVQYFYTDASTSPPQPARVITRYREGSGASGPTHHTINFTDGRGRVIQTKRESAYGAQTIVTDTGYDAMGNVSLTAQPHYRNETPADTFWTYVARDPSAPVTTTAYDALARPTVVTAPDGTMTQTAYSRTAVGWLATTTDAKSHQTSREMDLFGRLRTVTEMSGDGGSGGAYATYATTIYQYSPLDLLTQVVDAKSNTTTLSYDGLGRKMTATDPDLGTWQYQYDAAGNLVSQTDAKHQTTGFGYDALDRLIATSGATTTTYTYDQGTNGLGHRTGTTNAAATLTYVYDSRGRVTSTTESVAGQAGSWTIGQAYDSADRPTVLTYPGGEQVTTTYDPAGRATSLCTSLGNFCYAGGASYSALDQPTNLTLGNAVAEFWAYSTPMQRLTQHIAGAGGAVLNRTYTYDNVGNVATIHDALANHDQRFTYDFRDRLTQGCTAAPAPNTACDTITGSQATPAGYYNETDGYDTLGNLTSKGGVAYAYVGSGHVHAPASVGEAAYTYDANGNVTQEGQFGRSYTWDGRNLPLSIITAPPPPVTGTPSLTAPSRNEPVVTGSVSLTAPSRSEPVVAGTPSLTAPARGVGPQTSTVESYTYDADGQRVTRTANGITTVYIGGVYEQERPVGIQRSQYRFAGRVIAQRTLNAPKPLLYLHGDHLGSVSAVTDGSGTVVERQEFGPWGNIRSGGVSATTVNYTGQKRDGTGLLYYNARYYDPALGRFLSADSIGVDFKNPQSLNRYAYGLNNPVRNIDPTGHCVTLSFGNTCPVPGGDTSSVNPCTQKDCHLTDCSVDGSQCPTPQTVFDFHCAYGGVACEALANEQNQEPPKSGQGSGSRSNASGSSGGSNSGGSGAGKKNIKLPDNVEVFPNQLPGDLDSELARARQLGVEPIHVGDPGFDQVINSGRVKWAVTETGELVFIPEYVGGEEIPHSVLTGGRPVVAAGTADIVGSDGYYSEINIDFHSGHYQPSEESLAYGRAAFANAGIILTP